jgi:NitT/TauT family transport system permease protein
MGVIRSFGMLWTEYDLLGNVFMSWWRIAQAFFWCAVIAIPLGILMSSFRWLFELVNPIAAPMRAMPLTAFLPAFIALFGIDETEKIAFLWFGMFFYLLAVVVEEVNRVDNSCLKRPTHSEPSSGKPCGWCFARRFRRFSRRSASSTTLAGPT